MLSVGRPTLDDSRLPLQIVGDGKVRTIKVDLSKHPDYRDGMRQVRLSLLNAEGDMTLHAVSLEGPAGRDNSQ